MDSPHDSPSATSRPPRPGPRRRVKLYAGTWVAGERALHQLGLVESRAFVDDAPIESRVRRLETAAQRLLDALRARARTLGANAVLTVEVRIDPFALRFGSSGTELHASGSAVELECTRGGSDPSAEPELSGLLQ